MLKKCSLISSCLVFAMQQQLLASSSQQTGHTQHPLNEHLELRGIYEANDLLMLSIHNTESRRTHWHKILKSQTGTRIHSITDNEMILSTEDGIIALPIRKSDGLPISVPESFAKSIGPNFAEEGPNPSSIHRSPNSAYSSLTQADDIATSAKTDSHDTASHTADGYAHTEHKQPSASTDSNTSSYSASKQGDAEDSLAAIRARMAKSKYQITPKVRNNNVTGAPEPELIF